MGFIVKFWSASMEMISAGTMQKRESERLQRFDFILDAILISDQPTWNLIAHAHMCLCDCIRYGVTL